MPLNHKHLKDVPILPDNWPFTATILNSLEKEIENDKIIHQVLFDLIDSLQKRLRKLEKRRDAWKDLAIAKDKLYLDLLEKVAKEQIELPGEITDASQIAKTILKLAGKGEEKKAYKRELCLSGCFADYHNPKSLLYRQGLYLECKEQKNHKTMHWGTTEEGFRINWDNEGNFLANELDVFRIQFPEIKSMSTVVGEIVF